MARPGTRSEPQTSASFRSKRFYDASTKALVFGRSPDVHSFPRDVSWDTVIDGVDHFYDEPSNRRILVICALQVVNLELIGKPEAQIESAVRRNRCRGTVLREGGATDPVDFERRFERCLSPR